MRTGLNTIQQTLTPEAASVLNQSIAEAGRRNHGQTTPLHVAATLLASPTGYLRQACIRSHPNSSHPLQCRALELCFSVALDRLPSAQNPSPSLEPPISNALMAALKRAQAHQRRGCPEQQQQPLLAVKVELEQLIVSILDDPSVSRVMREASFSSPAVKATIEQSLNSSNSVNSPSTIGSVGLGFRPAQTANRNLYLNPRLQQGNSDQSRQQRLEEVKKVTDILLRSKKRNPVLVGEPEPELVVRDLLQRIEKKEVGEELLRNVQVISLEKEFASDRSQIPMKLKELGTSIDIRISSSEGSGVILNLGDLKWLVEPVGFGALGSGQFQQQIVSDTGRLAVAEMGKLLARFGEGNGRLWLIGTATCETYLRCQVYHPSMENEWDLQAVPIAARAPLPRLFPRLGGNGILSSSVESLSPLKGFPTATTTLSRRQLENMDPARRTKCCTLCRESYEQELAKLLDEFEKSSSDAKPETARQPLPQWLQIAKPDNGNLEMKDESQTKDQELMRKQKTEELQKKWNDTCSRLHPSFHPNLSSERIAPTALSMTSLFNSNPLGRQAFQPKLQLSKTLGGTLQVNQNQVPNPTSECLVTTPGSPIRTDLALGHPMIAGNSPKKTEREQKITDCIPSEPQDKLFESQREKLASTLDPDSFKSLFKGLAEKVCWQSDAASAVAATVIHCRSGNSKRQGFGFKGDTWLLFAGPDKIGKMKMAVALSELLCRPNPITIRIGTRCNDEDSDVNIRGKTTLDRIAEAVQRNPSSVIVLEDIDKADMLVHGNIKRAIERGRLPDSHGREVSLRNIIFILTANWYPIREEKLANVASRGCQLQLTVGGNNAKRRPDWLCDDNRSTRSRTALGPTISFDLNQAANIEDDTAEESRNSSDLTIENDHEQGLVNKRFAVTQVSRELLKSVDETIFFKPVDFGPLQSKVASTVTSKFSAIVDEGWSIEMDDEARDQILGGCWFGRTELEEWVESVLVPSFHKLNNVLPAVAGNNTTVVRLASLRESERRSNGDWLPSNITVFVNGCER